MKYRTLILSAIVIISLAVTAAVIITDPKQTSYLQDPYQIYTMEAGILKQNLSIRDGEDITITYEFNEPGFQNLLKKYNIEKTAGSGSSFHRAVRLMNEFAPRLTHKSDYDNHIEMRALPLLEYSLDKKQNGINCLNKAQILNEMCLALGIYSRKLWLMPYSQYDNDCHVLTYSHGQAHGNPAMVTTAAPQRASYTVSGLRDPSGLALWARRPSPVPFGS
ncbi:MAG: hypothetical protein MR563_01525 [Spirochaetales bacterium]|nr:hypothetical protein [Spirochaetales bacterium]